jgi:hypothetical protein
MKSLLHPFTKVAPFDHDEDEKGRERKKIRSRMKALDKEKDKAVMEDNLLVIMRLEQPCSSILLIFL